MKSKLPKILLLLLAFVLVVKPALRIAVQAAPAASGNFHHHCDSLAFARSRSKYDLRIADGSVRSHSGHLRAKTNDANTGYQKAQPALLGVLTERDLLNIHFRILPERKLFLQQGRLTV